VECEVFLRGIPLPNFAVPGKIEELRNIAVAAKFRYADNACNVSSLRERWHAGQGNGFQVPVSVHQKADRIRLYAQCFVSSRPGENRDGVRFAENMCPSKGTMDVFVEPVLPHPSLVILGVSPVALSLATQARQLGYHVTLAAPAADVASESDAHVVVDGFQPRYLNDARRFVVISTQGKGDEAALKASVGIDAAYHAFVGSRRKMAALREKLIAEGIDATAIDRIKAPAGLDLGAITPEEIAMSILAEITTLRRRGQRTTTTTNP